MSLFSGSADREGNSFLLDRQVGWSQKTTPVSSLDTSLLRVSAVASPKEGRTLTEKEVTV